MNSRNKMLGGILACVFLLAVSLWAQEIPLTSDSYSHFLPQWSPDTNWVVYKKKDATGCDQIYKVSSAGGAETALTSNAYYNYLPQWSPDGNWVVYMKIENPLDATFNYQIYKVPSAGGAETALTSDSYDHKFPQWSPDTNWIVYSKWDATGRYQIYKVPSAGGAETAVTSDGYHKTYPQWSPDGNWVVYEAGGQIHKVPSAGGAETVLTSDSGYPCFRPQWSPDGNWVVYRREDATGYQQIYKTSSVGIVGIEETASSIPIVFHLAQNYPNPFNSATSIRYILPMNSFVRLAIYNISGQLVRTLVNGEEFAGIHTIRWNGRDERGRSVSGGIYFYCLEAGNLKSTNKMLLLK